MDDTEARENQELLVKSGIAESMDDAAHMLVDMGEISEWQHAELLSVTERKRVYGDHYG